MAYPDALYLNEDRSWCADCGDYDAVEYVRAEPAIILDWLARQFNHRVIPIPPHPDSFIGMAVSRLAKDGHQATQGERSLEPESTCSNCRYWQADVPSGDEPTVEGLCRRASPRPATERIASNPQNWPRTYANEWCGEHPMRN